MNRGEGAVLEAFLSLSEAPRLVKVPGFLPPHFSKYPQDRLMFPNKCLICSWALVSNDMLMIFTISLEKQIFKDNIFLWLSWEEFFIHQFPHFQSLTSHPCRCWSDHFCFVHLRAEKLNYLKKRILFIFNFSVVGFIVAMLLWAVCWDCGLFVQPSACLHFDALWKVLLHYLKKFLFERLPWLHTKQSALITQQMFLLELWPVLMTDSLATLCLPDPYLAINSGNHLVFIFSFILFSFYPKMKALSDYCWFFVFFSVWYTSFIYQKVNSVLYLPSSSFFMVSRYDALSRKDLL